MATCLPGRAQSLAAQPGRRRQDTTVTAHGTGHRAQEGEGRGRSRQHGVGSQAAQPHSHSTHWQQPGYRLHLQPPMTARKARRYVAHLLVRFMLAAAAAVLAPSLVQGEGLPGIRTTVNREPSAGRGEQEEEQGGPDPSDDPAAAAMRAATGRVLAKGHTDGTRTFGQGFLLTDPTKPHHFMPPLRGDDAADRPVAASRFAFLLKEPLGIAQPCTMSSG
jgi:hypothetical protein